MKGEISQPAGARLQAAYCELHGLHYNPSSPGCAFCMRSRSSAKSGGQSFRVAFAVVLPIALAIAALWYFGLKASRSDAAAAGAEMEGVAGLGDVADYGESPLGGGQARLQAERFRPEIGRVESILYQTSPIQLEDVTQLEVAARALAEKIRTTETHPVRRQIGQRVNFWASRVGEELDVGYSTPNLRRARSEWEGMRGDLFGPTDWFRTADSSLIEKQTPAPPPVNPESIRKLQGVEADLRRLIKIGRNETSAIGEVLSEVETSEVKDTRRKWDRWIREWQGRVEEVATRMPPRPAMSSVLDVTMAYQELASALNELRLVAHAANDFGIPFQYERDARFSAAEMSIARADAYLKKVR